MSPVIATGLLVGADIAPLEFKRGGHMVDAFKAVLVRAVAAGLFVATGHAAAADTPGTFQLNWMAGGPHAGFAAAVAGGYYKDAGLDVTLVQGKGSGNTPQLVPHGRAQLAHADGGA